MVRHRQHHHSTAPRIHHRPLHHFDKLIVSKNGNLCIILVSWYPIIVHSCHYIVNPLAHFCVTYLSRLAFKYCRQRHLCTLVIIGLHLPLHTYHIILISSWYHIISCVTRLFPHIHNCYLGSCILHSGHTKKERKNKLLSKKREQRSL